MRVLILEFDAILCDLISLTLKRCGFEPIVCEDPIFVRDELANQRPDALIIDTRLPYQNGIDLLHELKDENLLGNLHVIVLSALGFQCIVQQAVDAGAQDFLVKPFDLETLVQKLKDPPAAPVNPLFSPTMVETLG